MTSRAGYRLRLAAGVAAAAVPLLAGAEAFLGLRPPADLLPFLGDDSPAEGRLAPHPVFGATYRSFEDFRQDNAGMMAHFLPLDGGADRRPTWAFFGNSFVQAPGMLADQARQNVPSRRVFNLGKNEPLQLRFAQLELLLEAGLRPERIFLLLMPVDTTPLGIQPLATLHVTPRGALTWTVRPPPAPLDQLVAHSRLALTGWVRSRLHVGNPQFNHRRLYEEIHPVLLADLRTLFAGVADLAAARRIPVTVILIPSHHQILDGRAFAFQDLLTDMMRPLGLDVFDPRATFAADPDPPGLYLPDRHLSPRGNQLLLRELLTHIGFADAGPASRRGTP